MRLRQNGAEESGPVAILIDGKQWLRLIFRLICLAYRDELRGRIYSVLNHPAAGR